MKKRFVCIVVLLVLAYLGFAEGKTEAAAGSAPVTLTFWGMVPWQSQDWFQPLMDSFYQKNPDIKVQFTGYGDPAILDALYAAAASKTGPDVYFLWFGWQQWPLVYAGFTEDLTGYKAKYKWDERISASALALASRDGKLWGIPFAQQALVLWARKDLLDKYNGGKVPDSMAELRAFGDKLAVDKIALAATASVDGWHLLRFTQMIIESHVGTAYMDRMYALDPTTSWDTPEVVSALAELKTWSQKYFQAGFLGTKPQETKIPFYNGKAAIEYQGTWMERNMKRDGQTFPVVPFFFPVDSTPRRVDAYLQQLCVTSASKHKAEGVRLADFWSIMDTQQQIADKIPWNPSLIGFKFPEPISAGNKLAQGLGGMPATPPWDGGLPLEFVNYVYEVQDGIAGGTMTPEQGAKRMQQGWADVRAKVSAKFKK